MKKLIWSVLLFSATSVYSQEVNIEMGLMPVYQVDVTDTEVKVATTFPIDVYIDGVVHHITTSGIFAIKFEEKPKRVFILTPNN